MPAKGAPDGYTLLLTVSAGVVIQPLLMKTTYDPVRDFDPVRQIVP